jgi:hypothetical protein
MLRHPKVTETNKKKEGISPFEVKECILSFDESK